MTYYNNMLQAGQIEVWGDMRAGDVDTRSRDWTNALADVNDHVASITAITITRQDLKTMNPSLDLVVVGSPYLDVTGFFTSMFLAQGIAYTTYVITIQVLTSQSRVLFRDALLTVSPNLG